MKGSPHTDMKMAACVYQVHDLRGRLLYIGSTAIGVDNRMRIHYSKGKFKRGTVVVTASDPTTLFGALVDEHRLIYRLRPPLNIEHNPDRDPNARDFAVRAAS